MREQLGRWEHKERMPLNPNSKEKRRPRKIGQRRRTKERNIKVENIFSVLQEEDTELLQEKEEPPQIVKIHKDEKKICEGKRKEGE